MDLKEKLELFNFSEEERRRAIEKHAVSLSLVSTEEIKDILKFLTSKNVTITKAHELTIFGNGLAEIEKKFAILEEIHESDIYRQNPSMINRNVIDIYKKINYCIQIGKPYKKEDGTYEPFLFSSKAWQQEFNKDMTVDNKETLNKEIITVEPAIQNEADTINNNIVDINEYRKAHEDMEKIEAEKTSFNAIRADLERELAELDSLKNMNNDMGYVGINDIPDEQFEIGRGRAA